MGGMGPVQRYSRDEDNAVEEFLARAKWVVLAVVVIGLVVWLMV